MGFQAPLPPGPKLATATVSYIEAKEHVWLCEPNDNCPANVRMCLHFQITGSEQQSPGTFLSRLPRLITGIPGGCLCLLYTRIDLPDTLQPRISQRSGNSCCPRGLTKNVVVNPIYRTDLRQRLRAIDRQLQIVRVEAHLHIGHD